MTIRHILFPTDFSPRAKSAERSVESMVRRTGGRLSILHAIELPEFFRGLPPSDFLGTELAAKSMSEARRQLEEALPGTESERKAEFGEPATVICDYAQANSVDLIMMPTHGYGVFRRALLGSVTSKVLHDCRCAVWTDAHSASSGGSANPGQMKIVCAVDLSDESLPLIRTVADLAKQFQANVCLAHAMPPLYAPESWEGMTPIELRSAECMHEDFARERLASLQQEAHSSFEVCLGSGEIATVLGEIARNKNADLAVVGRGHSASALGSIRSHIYGIIHESPCPVLSL